MNTDPGIALDLLLENPWLVYGLLILTGFVFGWLVSRVRSIRKIATLEAMLELEVESAEQRIEAMQQAFAVTSSQALRDNSEQFLQLARQSLGGFQQQADHSLQNRQQAVQNLVQPLEQALKRTEQQLDAFDRSRQDAHISLTTQINQLTGQHVRLEQETRNLVQALRRPEVRGQWGEISLRRLVELAGMTEHCDFSQQVTSSDGKSRPDMMISLPSDRQVVVDVKTPMDAYLQALASEQSELRQQCLQRHARQVRKRVDELAAKSYWAQFEHTPDFVVLFIPGDQFLDAALEKQPDLLERALEQRVMLATPTSLVALLRTIAHGWTQQKLNNHAMEIRESAEDFHQRLAVFSEHLSELGSGLGRVVDQFNRSVGSFDSKLLPMARRFADLGLRREREVSEPQPITTTPREPR